MPKNDSGKPVPKVTSAGLKNPPRMGSTILQKGGDGLYPYKVGKPEGAVDRGIRDDREIGLQPS